MDISNLAAQAGFGGNQRNTLEHKLTRFAKLVAEAEREAHSAETQSPLDANDREKFEEWIKSPPFERRAWRWPEDASAKWPGQYQSYEVELAWCAWKAAREAVQVDCSTCSNRGRIDGLSGESHCSHCKWKERWRTDHYAP